MATNWVDRVPTYPNRYKVTKSDGSFEYITLERADEPTIEGTPINAANLNALEALAAHAEYAQVLTGGTEIPTNADLNSYTTPGNYYCSNNTNAGTISNTPKSMRFVLTVIDSGGDSVGKQWRYFKQRFTPLGSTSFMYERLISTLDNGASWNATPWEQIPYLSQVTPSAIGAVSKAGDTLTGNLVAYSTNRKGRSLRNISVTSTAVNGNIENTDVIIMVRK